jgi:hypothetical protein
VEEDSLGLDFGLMVTLALGRTGPAQCLIIASGWCCPQGQNEAGVTF